MDYIINTIEKADVLNVDFEKINLNIKQNIYKNIGSGSGRQVFDLANGYVVKMAKNKRGFAQNIAEFNIALNCESDIIAKITSASEDFRFVIMEKAEKVKSISQVRKYYNVKNKREFFKLKELKFICRNYNLLKADLRRAASWGTINKKPVIIDYGFTRKVKKKYY